MECGELLAQAVPLAVYTDGVAGSSQSDMEFYVTTLTDSGAGKKAPIAYAQQKWRYGTRNIQNAAWATMV